METTTVPGIERIGWGDVGDAFRRHVWLAVTVFLLTFSAAAAAAFLMTPVYRSVALLVPAKDQQSSGGLSSALGRLGGLAGLAGINLPGGGSAAVQQGTELLKSRGFLDEFIRTRNLLPVLFADDWDSRAARWVVPEDDVPSMDDAVEKFRKDVLKIDTEEGATIRLIVEWTDPKIAASWANDLVATLNGRMRQRALDESKRSLAFLDKQLAETSTLETRQSIYRLIEEQLNTAMLANVREEFVFEVLDPAAPSDLRRPQRPQKGILLLLGLFAGLALASVSVALRTGFGRRSGSA
jgi:uncharacterized protein involved in exopolysaccharide biosynthesis